MYVHEIEWRREVLFTRGAKMEFSLACRSSKKWLACKVTFSNVMYSKGIIV